MADWVPVIDVGGPRYAEIVCLPRPDGQLSARRYDGFVKPPIPGGRPKLYTESTLDTPEKARRWVETGEA